jgi:hypothetical protein
MLMGDHCRPVPHAPAMSVTRLLVIGIPLAAEPVSVCHPVTATKPNSQHRMTASRALETVRGVPYDFVEYEHCVAVQYTVPRYDSPLAAIWGLRLKGGVSVRHWYAIRAHRSSAAHPTQAPTADSLGNVAVTCQILVHTPKSAMPSGLQP